MPDNRSMSDKLRTRRGFDRLRPKPLMEQLRDKGYTESTVKAIGEAEKPKSAAPKETQEDKEIREEQERRDRVIKATRGR